MRSWDRLRAATCVRQLLEAAHERGVPAATVLADTDLSFPDLWHAEATVALWQELTAVGNLARAVDEPGLGLRLGVRRQLTSYGVLGLALLASATARDALGIAQRYPDHMLLMTRPTVRRDGGHTTLEFPYGRLPVDVRRVLVERDLATFLTTYAQITGTAADCARVELAFPADPSAALVRGLAGAEPAFDAETTRAVIPDRLLDAPLPQADPYTLQQTLARCPDDGSARQPRNVRDQVLHHLRSVAPGVPSLEELSRQLMTTSRTLRRRLNAEGTSYRALVDRVRLTTAETLLRAGTMSVEQVAAAVGYAETSAFSHAFRRWTGISPRAYRERA
ncbi:MAG: AraC family transcriptional regulator [Micromonosporaceae bacterium]